MGSVEGYVKNHLWYDSLLCKLQEELAPPQCCLCPSSADVVAADVLQVSAGDTRVPCEFGPNLA